jgi:hypothetical protein
MCLKDKNIFKNLNIWEQDFFVKKFLTVIFTHNYIKAIMSATMQIFFRPLWPNLEWGDFFLKCL